MLEIKDNKLYIGVNTREVAEVVSERIAKHLNEYGDITVSGMADLAGYVCSYKDSLKGVNVNDYVITILEVNKASPYKFLVSIGPLVDLSDKIFQNINDQIANPAHYVQDRKYEPRKVIRDWDLNFNLGNVVKYVSRAGRKGDALDDLKKARQYLDFEIDALVEESAE